MLWIDALKAWLKVRKADGSDFLFVSQKGGALRPETATHLFFKYCKMASEERVARGERPIARSCWNFKILKHSSITVPFGSNRTEPDVCCSMLQVPSGLEIFSAPSVTVTEI